MSALMLDTGSVGPNPNVDYKGADDPLAKLSPYDPDRMDITMKWFESPWIVALVIIVGLFLAYLWIFPFIINLPKNIIRFKDKIEKKFPPPILV